MVSMLHKLLLYTAKVGETDKKNNKQKMFAGNIVTGRERAT